jgi:hypothetical protein
VPAEGYELTDWTWTGGGSSTDNPLVISGVSADLAVTANFQPFNHPPTATIVLPKNAISYPQGYAIPFVGSGNDIEDGALTSGAWTSSINGPLTLDNGTFSGLSPGTHTITFTVADSGGKTGSATRTITVVADSIISAVADATVRKDSTFGDDNFGTSTNIRVRPGNEDANAYLRFDLSSLSGPVGSARLKVTTTNSTAGSVIVSAVPDDSWGELTITYNNRPALGSTLGTIEIPGGVNNVDQYIDITDYINAQIAGNGLASLNLGPSVALITFHSREASTAARRPELRINIAPPSPDLFNDWTALHELAGEDSLPGADPDGDGVSNLLEYALGGNPTVPGSTALPAADTAVIGEVTHLTFRFSRIADPALVYEIWASNDLVNWGAAPIWFSTGAQNTEGEITVTDPVNMADHARRFLRLKVSRE